MKTHHPTSSPALRGLLFNSLKVAVKPFFTTSLSPKLKRRGLEFASLTTLSAKGVISEEFLMREVPATCYPMPSSPKAVLYLHGGAYLLGSPSTHASLTSHLAKQADASVFVPDYRLAPEHPFPAAVEDALACYQYLLDLGYTPDNITVAGDSAGGGLTLSLMLSLKAKALPLPKRMLLISPWANLTHPHSEAANQNDDAMLSWKGLQMAAQQYANNEQLSHPGISPALGNLEGLPECFILFGGKEILLDDGKELYRKLIDAGVEVDMSIYEQMWHVFPLHARILQEADAAIAEMADFIRK